MSKSLLKNLKDWEELKESHSRDGEYLQSEDEKYPNEYPCIVVLTRWYEGCRYADDQFCKFVYMSDFPNVEIRKQKIKNIENEN